MSSYAVVVDNKRNGGREKSEMLGKGSSLRITFKNLSYEVKNSANKKETLKLLDDVNGYMEPGELACLMGPSGSGKTTLMDVLAGRKTQGKITGDVRIGGEKPTKVFLRRYAGYVEQFDTLIDILTVEEMLMYTADLKLPTSTPREEKRERVEWVIDKLGLAPCRHTKIGNPLQRGISGGQAKRVNIGIALVSKPRILFLDEPTSGLDSFTSNEVMAVVKSVASSGVTVCATIHSPTEYTFRLFDRLTLLLSGRTVYFGLLGKSALRYFEASGLPYKPFTLGEAEAEWIVDITTKASLEKEADRYIEHYQKSELRQQNDLDLSDKIENTKITDEKCKLALALSSSTEVPIYYALWTLFKYRTVKNYKSPEFVMQRIGDKLLVSFILFSLYWGKGKEMNDERSVTNIAAFLFTWAVLPAFGASSYIPSITLDRKLYVRERSDGCYYAITYLIYKLTEELLLAAVSSLAFAGWVWGGIRLQGSFGIFWIQYYLQLCIGIALAYAIGAVAPTVDVANAALPAYVVTCLFFAGFLKTRKQIPRGWKWFSVIDFLTYSWGGLMKNQFKNYPDAKVNKEQVLKFYGHDDYVSQGAYTGYLSIFFFVFAFLAYLALAFKKMGNR